jgi:hydrogenase maturation protease
MNKTLIVGLGNPLLGDDGVGWRVAAAVQPLLEGRDDVEVEFLSVGGIRLMEHLVGYQRALIIDAINTRTGTPGTVSVIRLEDLPDLSAGHMTSPHDASLPTALRLGALMGAELPGEVIVIGIEAKDVYEFSEALSEPVAAAIEPAVQAVLAALMGG